MINEFPTRTVWGNYIKLTNPETKQSYCVDCNVIAPVCQFIHNYFIDEFTQCHNAQQYANFMKKYIPGFKAVEIRNLC